MNISDYISFREYKSDYTFCGTDDLFTDTSRFGCIETEFEKWLKSQRLFIKRFAESLNQPLENVRLPVRKWEFFQLHYERSKRTDYLVQTYPDGYFETVSDDGQSVACLLPDTYGKKPLRISFYRKNGPSYHETYSSRTEALTYLANHGYTPKQGALDVLVGTDEWDRGVYVTKWLAEGVHPMDGLKRDQHIPEVARLFPGNQ